MPRESVAQRIERGQRRLLSIDRKVYEHIASLEKLRKERSRIWRSIKALRGHHPHARGAKASSAPRAAPPPREPEPPATFTVRIDSLPTEPSLEEASTIKRRKPLPSKEQDRAAKLKSLERARAKAGIKPRSTRKGGVPK